jgi:hypothetical protein
MFAEDRGIDAALPDRGTHRVAVGDDAGEPEHAPKRERVGTFHGTAGISAAAPRIAPYAIAFGATAENIRETAHPKNHPV